MKPLGHLIGGPTGRRAVRRASVVVQCAPAPPPWKPEFQPDTLTRIAAHLPTMDAQFVKDRSPLCPATQSPASFLQRLFRLGESVIVFDVVQSQGVVIYTCAEPPYDAGRLDFLVNGCREGVWFLCNPVDREYHPNPRLDGKPSRRSEEAVTAWRYLVLESDKADARDWLAALVQMPLRIAAIYTSGGRSIHALVRLDANSKADWDAKAHKLKPSLTVLGADPGAITAVRLTRLPGCYRGQEGPPAPKELPGLKRRMNEPLALVEDRDPIWTPSPEPATPLGSHWRGGKLQELLYLDPEPDGQPILLRPTRQEVYQAWLAGLPKSDREVTCQR